MGTQETFGPYVLEQLIARGGMAEVFLARTDRPGFRKRLCVKRVLLSDEDRRDFATMFRDEASLAARLHHPNIVEVFDFGEVDGALYLAMEYVDGVTLGALLQGHLQHRVPLSLAAGVQIGISICRGLGHAHALQGDDGKALGVVHRDVSPQNVLLSVDGAVKLADFGIARASDRAVRTRTGMTKGKAAYMAPEQALAEPVDHRTDQFAAGIVLWEATTCRRLFRGKNDIDVMRKVVEAKVPPPSSARREIPPALDRAIMRALARDPAERFPDVADFEAALAEVAFAVARSPLDLDLRRVVANAKENRWPEDTVPMAGLVDEGPFEENTEPTEPAVPGEHTEPGVEPMLASAEAGAEATLPMPLAPNGARLEQPMAPVRAWREPTHPKHDDDRRPSLTLSPTALVLAGVAAIALLLGGTALGWLVRGSSSAPAEPATVVTLVEPPAPAAPAVVEPPVPSPPPSQPTEAEPDPEPEGDPPPAEPAVVESGTAKSGTVESAATAPAKRTAAARRAPPNEAAPDENALRTASAKQLEGEAMKAFLAGDTARAVSLLQKATQLDPRRASAYKLLGQAHERQGQPRLAIAAYQIYLQLGPAAVDRELVTKKIDELGKR